MKNNLFYNTIRTMALDKPKPIGGEDSDLTTVVINIINGVIGALGIACVVVIIIGGLNYMLSSGDAAKVKKARDTILYGIIGMVVCVLAAAIVNFVITSILPSSS